MTVLLLTGITSSLRKASFWRGGQEERYEGAVHVASVFFFGPRPLLLLCFVLCMTAGINRYMMCGLTGMRHVQVEILPRHVGNRFPFFLFLGRNISARGYAYEATCACYHSCCYYCAVLCCAACSLIMDVGELNPD